MKTVKVNVYKFSELSEQAKEKARNWWREGGLNYEWWDYFYYDAERIGLKITSFDLDRNRHAEGDFLLAANEVAANIFKEHGEQCETYKTATQFMEEWEPVFNDYMDENGVNYESEMLEGHLMELEEEFLSSLLEDYSIMLQNEYEYMYSDEYVNETITINEYDFTEDGSIF
jgi:hypothetical protein